jgi:uncharacterized membrane protein YphA (DoxX/SURF4 family)
MIRNKRVLFLFRLLVGGVFIWAGVLKVGDPLDFAQSIKNYQAFPHDLVFMIALVLPWVEVLSGVGLIAGVLKRSSAFIAAVLLAGFIALVGSALLRGIDTSCGCFGSLSSRADLRLMLMDAVLCLMAVAVFANARPGNEPTTGPSRSR